MNMERLRVLRWNHQIMIWRGKAKSGVSLGLLSRDFAKLYQDQLLYFVGEGRTCAKSSHAALGGCCEKIFRLLQHMDAVLIYSVSLHILTDP